MVKLDDKASKVELGKDVRHDLEHLSVGNHGRVNAGAVVITLEELAEATTLHCGVVTAIYLRVRNIG